MFAPPRCVTVALLYCLLSTLGGCDSAPQDTSQQQAFSALTELNRSAVREVLRHYRSSSPDGVDVRTIMPLIANEGMRHFPQATFTDDFLVNDYSYALIDGLPSLDYWGDPDPTGGYISFDETVHDSDGEIVGDPVARKRASYFTAGDVVKFDYEDSSQANGARGEKTWNRNAFTLQTDAMYATDAWHQQKASKRSSESLFAYDEVYTYTTHPAYAMSVLQGGAYDLTTIVTDTISSQSGWSTNTESEAYYNLAGTITRYRPSVTNAQANASTESPLDVDSTRTDTLRTTTSSETTSSESTTPVGIHAELLETVSSTVTSHEVVIRDATIEACTDTCVDTDGESMGDACPACGPGNPDNGFFCENACVQTTFSDCTDACEASDGSDMPYACPGCDLSDPPDLAQYCSVACEGPGFDFDPGALTSSSSEFHSTDKTTYALRPGFGKEAIDGRGLELFADHVVTTRVLTEVSVQGADRITEITTYRYTDNRANRNQIANWKSTRQTIRRTYRLEMLFGFPEFEWDEEDSGVEWLTSEVEIDPAFNAVPYTYTATTKTVSDVETWLFGDDQSASESTSTTTVNRDEEASWNLSQVSVSGSHTIQSANIANGDSQTHSVSSNADGSYSISVGDTRGTVGAEEWLDSIAP